MNEMQIFNYNEKQVRTVEKNGDPWFVLKDVCEALGISKHRDTAERLDTDERGSARVDTLGGAQEMIVINESGLYHVILRSDKPEAVPFRRWVTSEVLPSIRKHGAYATAPTIEKMIADPDFAIRLLGELKQEQERRKELELQNSQQRQIIGELQPKADYMDIILQNKGLVTITQIAKDYGMSGNRLNKLLNQYGVQYKQSGQWLLYRKYHSMGYTHSQTIDIMRSDGRPDIVMETKWTQKGRVFIYELLKKEGIVPVIEKSA